MIVGGTKSGVDKIMDKGERTLPTHLCVAINREGEIEKKGKVDLFPEHSTCYGEGASIPEKGISDVSYPFSILGQFIFGGFRCLY